MARLRKKSEKKAYEKPAFEEVQIAEVEAGGSVVLPKSLRDKLGLQEGTLIVIEEKDGTILIRTAVSLSLDSEFEK